MDTTYFPHPLSQKNFIHHYMPCSFSKKSGKHRRVTINYTLHKIKNCRVAVKNKLTTIIPWSHHCGFCRSLLVLIAWWRDKRFSGQISSEFLGPSLFSVYGMLHTSLAITVPLMAALCIKPQHRWWGGSWTRRLMASKDFECVDTTGQQDANRCSWRSKEKSHNLMRRGDSTLKSPLRL